LQRSFIPATIVNAVSHIATDTRTPFNVLRSLMLPTGSQVNSLGSLGLWNYSIPSCEIQQEHSYLTQLYWNQLLVDLLPVVSIYADHPT